MEFFTYLGALITLLSGAMLAGFLVAQFARWVHRKIDKTSPNTMWINFHKDERSGLEYITAYSNEDMARKVASVQGKAKTLRYVRA